MFKSTYGAGLRAGLQEPTVRSQWQAGDPRGWVTVIVEPVCPFPPKRFISRSLWHFGFIDGQLKRLSQPLKRKF